MESVAALQCSCVNFCLMPCDWAGRSLSNRVEFKPMLAGSWIQQRQRISRMKCGNRKGGCTSRKHNAIRASMQSSNSDSSDAPVAPLQLESPVGQYLCQILRSHPHLVAVAAEQQLEQLQSDREAEKDKEEPSTSSTELVLYRRIAEVKSSERKKALEEILYALIVQKFMDANVRLLPSIALPHHHLTILVKLITGPVKKRIWNVFILLKLMRWFRTTWFSFLEIDLMILIR